MITVVHLGLCDDCSSSFLCMYDVVATVLLAVADLDVSPLLSAHVLAIVFL